MGRSPNNRNRIKLFCLGLAVVLLAPLTLSAVTVYTWVDDQGQQHFSQTPPDNLSYRTVTPDPVPAPPEQEIQRRLESLKSGHADYEKRREKKQEQKAVMAEKEAEKKQLCRQASKMHETLTVRRRVVDGDGALLTDPQRAERLKQAAEMMRENC